MKSPTSSSDLTFIEGLRRNPSRERLIDEIDSLIMLESMQFLSMKDLLSLSRVSQRYNRISKSPILWKRYSSYFFRVTPEIASAVIDMPSFIIQYLKYPEMLAQSQTGVYVVIRRHVYDLNNFVHEHPGGDAILHEWQGRDATRIFDLAHHSTFALDLADSFLIWSPHEGPR
jgi:hypothetical protein